MLADLFRLLVRSSMSNGICQVTIPGGMKSCAAGCGIVVSPFIIFFFGDFPCEKLCFLVLPVLQHLKDGYGLKTLPKVKDLTSLIQELMTEQKKQYQKYRETRTEMQNWQAVKQNLDSALNRAEKEKHRGLDR